MEEGSSLKKKIVASATAASILIGGAFTPPANLPEPPQDRMAPPAIVEMMPPPVVDDDDDGDVMTLPEEEKKRKGARQKLIWAVPLLVVAWTAGILLSFFAISSLNIVLGTVAGWIITAALFLLTYYVVSKVMFPELKAKQIFSPKAVIAVIIGAAAVSFIAKGLIFR